MASIGFSAMCSRGNAVCFCLGGHIAGAIPPELRCKLRYEHVSMRSPDRECGIQARFVEDDSKPALIISWGIGEEFSTR
jgi:hypothetical protein